MEQLFGQQHPREDDDGDRLSVDAGLSDWQRSGRFLLFFTESVIQSLYIGQCATKASKINWPSAVWLSAYDIASLRKVIKLYSFNFIVWPENTLLSTNFVREWRYLPGKYRKYCHSRTKLVESRV